MKGPRANPSQPISGYSHDEASTDTTSIHRRCEHGSTSTTRSFGSDPAPRSRPKKDASAKKESPNSSPLSPSARGWGINGGYRSMASKAGVMAECLGGVLDGLRDTGRKHLNLWYSGKAFAAIATAAVVVLVLAAQGQGDTEAMLRPNGGTNVAGVGSRLRSNSLAVSDEAPVQAASIPLTAQTASIGLTAQAAAPSSAASTVPALLGRAKLSDERSMRSDERSMRDILPLDTDVGIVASAPSPKRARIGYLIMTSGVEELEKTKRLLKAIYDPSNFYLVHLDRKNEPAVRSDLAAFISVWENVRMLEPALDVSWGGYTITLTAIFGICKMVQWSDEWDFFVNLSASDFPLLPQAELREVLGQFADVGMNFVSGAPLEERNRAEVIVDDQGLYREKSSSKAGKPLKVGKPRLPPSSSMFTIFKGEFWVILHKSFCRYIEASPDNVARSLQAYFSRFRISDESYFQTVLCHPLAPNFPVYSDNGRFVSWPPVGEGYYVLHPDPITSANVGLAMQSGALFARKFDLEMSQEAYTQLEESLSTPEPDRLGRAVHRLGPASTVDGRQAFCYIPEGYSIQKVLSRPPKMAMGMRHEIRPPDAINTARGPTVEDDGYIITPHQSTQAREALEGKESTP